MGAITPPSLPGIDASGLKRNLLTDTTGQLTVLAGGYCARVGTTFTRPADTTAYASGDLVANSTTAGSVVPVPLAIGRIAGGTGQILRARLRKSGTSITNASFRVHLFRNAPTVAGGDNAVFSASGAADYLGAFDVTVDQAFSDGASGTGVPNAGSVMIFDTVSPSLSVYALVEARGAYTPVSGETFAVVLEVVRD